MAIVHDIPVVPVSVGSSEGSGSSGFSGFSKSSDSVKPKTKSSSKRSSSKTSSRSKGKSKPVPMEVEMDVSGLPGVSLPPGPSGRPSGSMIPPPPPPPPSTSASTSLVPSMVLPPVATWFHPLLESLLRLDLQFLPRHRWCLLHHLLPYPDLFLRLLQPLRSLLPGSVCRSWRIL